jgi:hypothetical protein
MVELSSLFNFVTSIDLILAVLSVRPVEATVDRYGSPCVGTVQAYNFGCDQGLKCLCPIDAFVETVLYCIDQYSHTEDEKRLGYEYLRIQCFYKTNLAFTNEQLQQSDKDAHRRISTQPQNVTSVVHSKPFAVSPDLVRYNIEVRGAQIHNKWISHVFG